VNYASPLFLLAFPPFLLGYWCLRGRIPRLVWLLIGSVTFYAYGDAAGLPVLVGVGAVAWATGLALGRTRRRRFLVATAIAVLVLDLAIFKYIAFAAGALGAQAMIPALVAPLGISFFTFEAIAYIVDVHRGLTPVERSPFRFSLYITLFPHLVSGPIMRPNDLLPQFKVPVTWRAS
jgi:D-alanyl-lipoteichoic acid acyltransferase DltB (MBOAT superfamily)